MKQKYTIHNYFNRINLVSVFQSQIFKNISHIQFSEQHEIRLHTSLKNAFVKSISSTNSKKNDPKMSVTFGY